MTDWVFPKSTLGRVVDGDSFYANVTRQHDHGFHVIVESRSLQKFRLNRAAAAPLKTLSGLGARLRLEQLLIAGPFQLTSVGAYKYGDTWMAEVVLADGRNVTDVLVAEEWAASWSGQGAQPLPPWPRSFEETR